MDYFIFAREWTGLLRQRAGRAWLELVGMGQTDSGTDKVKTYIMPPLQAMHTTAYMGIKNKGKLYGSLTDSRNIWIMFLDLTIVV